MKEKILKLRSEGKTYDEIKEILGCSKSTISYHCSQGQKEKTLERQRKNRSKEHPYKKKVEQFSKPSNNSIRTSPTTTTKKRLKNKLERFFSMERQKSHYNKPTFTVQDVIDKFGNEPICYLTGDPIDIDKTRSYHFDHIIPRSRGGQNTLDNLGLASKHANQAKSDMTPDEFINFCKKVLEHNGYKVTK